jgi:hypothetical protein
MSFEALDTVTQEFFEYLVASHTLGHDGFHGREHWLRALQNARELAAETGANLRVLELFAVLHDSRRENENHDPEHGHRAAAHVVELRGKWFDLPVALRQSMTCDRGSEMACRPKLVRRLKINIWFCDPHAPLQRGTNENNKGLLRQFMPKGTDLSDASQTWLNDAAALMNNRPRKTLPWRTLAETMADEIAAFKSIVVLEVGI